MASADAFLASLGINAFLALAFLLLFSLLRLRSPSIYSPRAASAAQRPADLPPGLFGWLRPLLALDERAVFESAGLDVTMYLRFVRLSLHLFAVSSLVGCAGLMPLVLWYPYDSELLALHNMTGNTTWLESLAITHVPDASPVLWGHFVFVYLFTMLTLALLHINYRDYTAFRHESMVKGGAHLSWVLVKEIPDTYADEEELHRLFSRFLARQ